MGHICLDVEVLVGLPVTVVVHLVAGLYAFLGDHANVLTAVFDDVIVVVEALFAGPKQTLTRLAEAFSILVGTHIATEPAVGIVNLEIEVVVGCAITIVIESVTAELGGTLVDLRVIAGPVALQTDHHAAEADPVAETDHVCRGRGQRLWLVHQGVAVVVAPIAQLRCPLVSQGIIVVAVEAQAIIAIAIPIAISIGARRTGPLHRHTLAEGQAGIPYPRVEILVLISDLTSDDIDTLVTIRADICAGAVLTTPGAQANLQAEIFIVVTLSIRGAPTTEVWAVSETVKVAISAIRINGGTLKAFRTLTAHTALSAHLSASRGFDAEA
ncbi:MAG: hypothetical protein MK101_12185 [Phycisphaerales bacterium]|nr:hypothetical protein [Phycisphaerales bacterium]